ncbi:hypothetical protein IV57_GL000468 [Companilactobacillus kimchiensis]|uniref:Uncharacterized protein n=2 Tax=Companilactobacillus kimchiensis TaxID=993692 RepID=A0A0R2LBD9_9LACO|nr:hypothetical protein IV57_GL000468 [Companilactobacillus kimchiensis]
MGYIGGAIKSDFIIPFTEMDNLALIHWHGSQQITFSYQDLSFEFIENGFGEINYLKNILFQNSMIK